MSREAPDSIKEAEAGRGGALVVESLSKSFGAVRAVRGLSFEVGEGELVSLLGPSGCGKSTVLNAIAGFAEPDDGRILLSGQDVTRVPPYRRNTAMVFQNYALFPHMTVRRNVAFGLETRRSGGLGGEEIGSRVSEVLGMLGLEDLGDRYPARLSGGQQQRVAVARALVVRPEALLMDEPLSNLDAKLRQEIRQELRNLQRRLRQTVVFVTHDQQEAFAISDRVVLMRDGEIVQQGTPAELFRRPRTVFAADFVGVSNIFSGRLQNGRFVTEEGLTLPLVPGRTEQPVHAGIRPSAVGIGPAGKNTAGGGHAAFEGAVEGVTYLGEASRYAVRISDSKASFLVDAPDNERSRGYSTGDRVTLTVAPDDVLLLTSDR